MATIHPLGALNDVLDVSRGADELPVHYVKDSTDGRQCSQHREVGPNHGKMATVGTARL